MEGLIEKHQPRPINREAAQAIQDPGYCQGLREYDRTCAALLDPVWEKEYLHGGEVDEPPQLEPMVQDE
jgi:hypothetical protein